MHQKSTKTAFIPNSISRQDQKEAHILNRTVSGESSIQRSRTLTKQHRKKPLKGWEGGEGFALSPTKGILEVSSARIASCWCRISSSLNVVQSPSPPAGATASITSGDDSTCFSTPSISSLTLSPLLSE